MVEFTPFGEELERIANDPRCKSITGCFNAAVNPDQDQGMSPLDREPSKIPDVKPIPMYRYPEDFDWGALYEKEGPRLPDGSFISPALREVINDENILVTKEMLPIINNPEIVVTRRGQPAKKLSGLDVIRRSGQFSLQNIMPDLSTKKKKKRKVSTYQKSLDSN